MDYDEFIHHTRDALAHLYDPVHLQSHPLANLLDNMDELDRITRAQKLRRMLLDALEQLSPPTGATVSADASACYYALHYRYVDGLAPEQMADILAISPRQVYRKIREGVEAVSSLLWDQMQQKVEFLETLQSSTDGLEDRRILAQAAVRHLGNLAKPEVLELGIVLNNIAHDLHSYCHRIGLEIELHLPPKPLYVCVDRTILRQALINVLTNGLDQPEGCVLAVTVEQNGDRLQLVLEMQGKDETRSPLRPAARREGIGMEVATELFRIQGIRFQHEPNEKPWQVKLSMPQAGPHRILVIDDMPDIPHLFQRFATTHAVEVIGAENADQAFEILQHLSPTLILLDVMLPRRDGWEILQTLKSDPATAHIPVVICSILNEPELATVLGADGYLRKPINQEALLEVLERWLHQEPEPAAVRL